MKKSSSLIAFLLAFAAVSRASYLTSLQAKIDTMQKEIYTLMRSYPLAGVSPVAHVQTHSSGRYSSGSTLTAWQSEPLLAGGMDFVNGGIVVPFSGIYYIYGQILFDPHSSSGDSRCAFALRANSQTVAVSYSHLTSRTGSDDHTSYTGLFWPLSKGDVITVRMVTTCTLDYHHSEEAFFGAFYILYDFSDNSGSPAALMGTTYSGTYSSGSVFSRWYGSYFNYQYNGASTSRSYIRVSRSGLYFFFGQMQLELPSIGENCGFYLKRDGSNSTLANTYIQSSGGDNKTQYTGVIVNVPSSDYLRLYTFSCYYYNSNYNYGSFLGAFYLPFQKGPAVHFTGSYSGSYYQGQTLTGSWRAVVTNGGVSVAASGFTILKSGLYFVYGQLHLDPTSSSMKKCGYEIRSGSKVIAVAQSWVSSPANRDRVVYTASVAYLIQGSTVFMRMRGYCYLRYGGGHNFLGSYYVRRDY